MSSCLVVGGGFIGGAVAQRLTAAGHEVTVYSRSFGRSLEVASQDQVGLRLVRGEIPPGEALQELMRASDLVLYLAGRSTPAASDEDAGQSVAMSVVPATTVLDLAGRSAVPRFVLASSGGTVYGQATRHPTPEDYPADPISLHGYNALTTEHNAEFFARRHGLELVILRYSNPYGPGQIARRGQGVIAAWTAALSHGRPIEIYGDPQTRRDFIYIDDTAEATVRAGLKARPGIYNVGSGSSVTLAELIDQLVQISGRSAPVIHHGHRRVDVSRTELDCARLRAEVNWSASTSLEEGLRATWAAQLTAPASEPGPRSAQR